MVILIAVNKRRCRGNFIFEYKARSFCYAPWSWWGDICYRRTGVWYSVDRPGVELATQLATHIAAVQPGVSGKFLPPLMEFFSFGVQRPNSWTKSRQKSFLLFTVTCLEIYISLKFKLTQPLWVFRVRYCVTVYTVKEKGGKPDRKPHPLPNGLRNPYRNLNSENSQNFAQKHQQQNS